MLWRVQHCMVPCFSRISDNTLWLSPIENVACISLVQNTLKIVRPCNVVHKIVTQLCTYYPWNTSPLSHLAWNEAWSAPKNVFFGVIAIRISRLLTLSNADISTTVFALLMCNSWATKCKHHLLTPTSCHTCIRIMPHPSSISSHPDAGVHVSVSNLTTWTEHPIPRHLGFVHPWCDAWEEKMGTLQLSEQTMIIVVNIINRLVFIRDLVYSGRYLLFAWISCFKILGGSNMTGTDFFLNHNCQTLTCTCQSSAYSPPESTHFFQRSGSILTPFSKKACGWRRIHSRTVWMTASSANRMPCKSDLSLPNR